MLPFRKKQKKTRKDIQLCYDEKCYDGMYLPLNDVNITASKQQLMDSLAKVQETWSHLGEEKAHFSVITNDQYLPDNLDGNSELFWESGDVEADMAVAIFQRYREISDSTVCVEYGCGVGRVSFGLARYIGNVHAYDVSTPHLEHAKKRLIDLKADSLIFHSVADDITAPLESCDFFYSKIVFQHNPPHIIYYLIQKALCSLKNKGIAIFQVPVYRPNYEFDVCKWLSEQNEEIDMEMHCLPQSYIYRIIEEEHCSLLEVWDDNATGAPERFISKTFVVQKKNKFLSF